MKRLFFLIIVIVSVVCMNNTTVAQTKEEGAEFKVQTEQFADLAILRYQIPGFENLSVKQKELAFYLYQAALSGRDIMYDQNYKHNLLIRKTLEAVVKTYNGDRNSDEFKKFMVYAKRFWFSSGLHHHYSSIKFVPECSNSFFKELVLQTPVKELPLKKNQTAQQLADFLSPVIFNAALDANRVNQSAGADVVAQSANNFYVGLTQKEVENFYATKIDKNDKRPVSIGLNSQLVKKDGKIFEKVWKIGGMYSAAIEQIVFWLKKAVTVAENEQQKKVFNLLIQYYETGDLRKWDEYSIEWVKDTESIIDITNGFIETYGDPLNYKATFESVLSLKDIEASKRIDAISRQAQWFEDNSPIREEHKKKDVKGISAKVITVIVESGDASPSTPIGINLPNATWIRKEHGSKSVNLGNIVHSYNLASSEAQLREFAYNDGEIELSKLYGSLSDDLHTDMHEVIGHASGQINEGVGTPRESLKNYASTIEEARADLVALYYIFDDKLVEIGVMPSIDAGKAEYNKYIRSALVTQLQRLKPGENLEEAHMRNRHIIAKWAYERGKDDKVIEKIVRDEKTFFVINDYKKLRAIFGELLREMQRISSEGDFKSAQALVENFGVFIDKELHAEVLQRFEKLHIAPYRGFINPVLKPVYKGKQIVDVQVEYPEDFTGQMLQYGKDYGFLPFEN